MNYIVGGGVILVGAFLANKYFDRQKTKENIDNQIKKGSTKLIQNKNYRFKEDKNPLTLMVEFNEDGAVNLDPIISNLEVFDNSELVRAIEWVFTEYECKHQIPKYSEIMFHYYHMPLLKLTIPNAENEHYSLSVSVSPFV